MIKLTNLWFYNFPTNAKIPMDNMSFDNDWLISAFIKHLKAGKLANLGTKYLWMSNTSCMFSFNNMLIPLISSY